MARSTAWKQLERDIGRFFGTMRKVGSGGMGRADHVRSDAHHPVIFIEAKNRKSYGAVAVASKIARDEAAKSGRVGALLFPGQKPIIAVHSSDLLKFANGMYGTNPYQIASRCYLYIAPHIRNSFRDLDDAEGLAAMEDMPMSVLVIKQPRMQGFLLVFRTAYLEEICRWRIAGMELVNRVATRAGRLEHVEEVPMDAIHFMEVDSSQPLIATRVDELERFQHHWHPPKLKKDKNGKSCTTGEDDD